MVGQYPVAGFVPLARLGVEGGIKREGSASDVLEAVALGPAPSQDPPGEFVAVTIPSCRRVLNSQAALVIRERVLIGMVCACLPVDVPEFENSSVP